MTRPTQILLTLLFPFSLSLCLSSALAATAEGPPSEASADDIARVRAVIQEARELGTVADPELAASRWIVAELRRLGEPGTRGALALLDLGDETPDVLAALVEALAATPGAADVRVCDRLRRILAADPAEEVEEEEVEGPAEPVWAALQGLRSWRPACGAAITELAARFERTTDPALRFEILETLSWVGRTPDDVAVVQALADGPVSDCERRLLGMAGLRIMDRFVGTASTDER